jgi:hypothetical protein
MPHIPIDRAPAGEHQGRGHATWLLLQRDLGDLIPTGDSAATVSTLILDPGKGVMLAAEIGVGGSESLVAALGKARLSTAGGRQGAPTTIRCPRELVTSVRLHLAVLRSDAPVAIEETIPGDDAEDTFDQVVSLLLGVEPQMPMPHPDDTRMLYALALRFLMAAPWNAWTDEDRITITTRIADAGSTVVAIVLGAEEVHQGLLVGASSTADAGHVTVEESGEGVIVPGTLVVHYEPDLPRPFRERAYRYGWPASATVVPLMAMAGREGMCTLTMEDTRRLVTVLSGVTEAANLHRGGGVPGAVAGGLTLADGTRTEYVVTAASGAARWAERGQGRR